MLNISPAKILIVLVVALLLLGPDKLPQVARQLGAAWRTLRGFHERVEQEVRDTIPDLPSSADLARLARSPVAFLNQLADMPADQLEEPVPDPGAEAPAEGEGDWPADAAAPGPADPPAPPAAVAPAEAEAGAPAAPAHPSAPVAPGAPARPVRPVTPLPAPSGLSVPDDPSMN
jgi:sec-independent protein translocase protein TatB